MNPLFCQGDHIWAIPNKKRGKINVKQKGEKLYYYLNMYKFWKNDTNFLDLKYYKFITFVFTCHTTDVYIK